MTISRIILAAAAAAAAIAPVAMAAEGGAGLYLLGSRTTNAGIVAPPGTYAQASLYGFSGSTDVSGETAAAVSSTSLAAGYFRIDTAASSFRAVRTS